MPKIPNFSRRRLLAGFGLAGGGAMLGNPLSASVRSRDGSSDNRALDNHDSTAAPLRASVVKTDITPSTPQWLLGYQARQSTGVHDHLYLRVVAIDDGHTRFFLISTDICLFSPSLYDEVALALHQDMGITPLQLWWTTTHTHSAPELGPPGLVAVFMPARYDHDHNTKYTAWVKAKLREAVKEADARLEPARLGVGWGLSLANMNRRARDLDGHTSLGLNPDLAMDRRIGLIRFDKPDGKPLVLLANYSMHGTVLGGENLQISADAPGEVAEYVETQIGVPMLYLNGAAGNMAPIYTVQPDFKKGHLSEFRVLLGNRILEANQRIEYTTASVKLHLGEEVVETPRKAGIGWASDLSKYLRVTSAGETMVRLPVRFLKINSDIVVWAAPIELFCEIAMRVRDESPFPYTFYVGYCNGWLGYFPTQVEFSYGGYEPNTSPYTGKGEGDLRSAVLSRLAGLQI
jgi:neutral ceramidase